MLYKYKCDTCGYEDERFRPVADRAEEYPCPLSAVDVVTAHKIGEPLFGPACDGTMKFIPIQKTNFKIQTQADDGKEYM